MNEDKRKVLRISAFVLTLLMLFLFSYGTALTAKPNKNEVNQKGEVQYSFTPPSVKLKKFDIATEEVKAGSKIKINIKEEAIKGKLEYYALWAKNSQTGEVYYDAANYNEEGTYEFVTGSFSPGTYIITGLTAAMSSENDINNSYYYYYMESGICNENDECENSKLLTKSFKIANVPIEEDDSPIYDYVMGFYENMPTVSVGDKIDVSVNASDYHDEINLNRKPIYELMVSYTNENDGSVLNMFVKDLKNKPYLIIPSTATPGRYNLTYGYLSFVDGTKAKYQNTPKKVFSYNTSFVVKEKELDKTKYSFNNELYDNNIATALNKLDSDAIITISANMAPIINSEIFEVIKNTKRTLIIDYQGSLWVFSGADIINPKTIDVSTLVSDLTTNTEYYNEFLKTNVKSPSALLKFQDNGELPGKALIRIPSYMIDPYLRSFRPYVYYYKEDSDKLIKVAMEIQKNNNYYEFYINHNSKYIITSEEIKTDAVSDDIEMLKLNNTVQINKINQSNSYIVYVLATCCGVLAILLLTSIIINKKQAKNIKKRKA